ncbi:oligomeric, coiled-coil, peripheral membrane protein [Malassezia brasiliensis]|uniref:Autophagy-related protein 11 n=1 Tax=Malassezia brasiliensis TaxID=1821822 RepID=A0AAF0DS47_9BASI|nr:oligomeric, coiled-coil, peripheral membrane protein [Malassezia brasiliensis]
MRLVVSYCGREIEVKQTLWQFRTLEHFLDCVSLATGILYDSIICITKQGVQVNETAMDELLAYERDSDLEFYVFDRKLLYADLEVIAPQLELELDPQPDLTPPHVELPATPLAQLEMLEWAQDVQHRVETQYNTACEVHACIERIHTSTLVALANLQAHTVTIKRATKTLEEIASKELGSMDELLQRYEHDLYVLSRVPIETKLLAKPVPRNAKPPTLGDFVDAGKIRTTAKECRMQHSELQTRYANTVQVEVQLAVDLADLVSEIHHTHIEPSTETLAQIREVYQCTQEAVHELEVLHENASDDTEQLSGQSKRTLEHVTDMNRTAARIDGYRTRASQNLAYLVSDRNELVHRHLNLVQDISSLQSDYADLGAALAEIDAALASSGLDGFKRLHRLKKMLWAYGASLIEGVRRTEFTPLFMDKAQRLAELMAQFTESERAARMEFATHVASQLPFELVLETQPPVLDVTTRRRDTNETHALTRQDLDAFLERLQVLEHDTHHAAQAALIAEVRTELQNYMARLDRAEATFAVIAARELHLNEDESDDASEASRHSPISSQQLSDTLRRQLQIAQQRSERLEEELQRRTAEWSEERAALQRAASLAHSRLEASAHEADAQRTRVHTRLESISERISALHVADTQTLEQVRSELSGVQEKLRSDQHEWTYVGALLARVSALHQYACAPDALHPPAMHVRELSEADTRAELQALDPDRFLDDVHGRMEWLVAHIRRMQARAAAVAQVPLSLDHIAPGDVALFLPAQTRDGRWMAFQLHNSHCYLRMTEALRHTTSQRDWLVGRVTRLETHEATARDALRLPPGTAYSWVDVEGWEDADTLFSAHLPTSRPPWFPARSAEARPPRKSSGSSKIGAPWQPRADAPQRALTVDGSTLPLAIPRTPSRATEALMRLNSTATRPGQDA